MRMSKGPLVANDKLKEARESEGKINMVSGYKDLGLAKMDALKDKNSEPFGTEFKHVFTSPIEERDKSGTAIDELREMKELLLIHLDFIQQQSEQLTTRDRQINELKNENEMLKMRIDRMERRVALQKCRTTVENGDGGKGDSSGLKRRRRQSEESASPRGKQRLLYQDLRPHSLSHSKRVKPEEGNGERSRTEQTMTDESYWTLVGERDSRWTAEPPSAPSPKPSALEQVPRWRTKIFSSSYTMEGTENLSDDVFNRRHYRLEYDERRRKKWDVQRMREQRQVERLSSRSRAGEEEGVHQEETLQMPSHPHLLTFSIQTSLPVTAFGFPMPVVPHIVDFALPWLVGKESHRRSRSVSRRGKR